MPELPEVETIRRHLAPHVDGRPLDRLEIHDARWSLPLAPAELSAAVEGRRVERLGRRGKYLVWELEDEAYLMLHLRMTGTLLLQPARAPAAHARHVRPRRHGAAVRRPAALRHRRAGARRGRARRVLRRAPGRRAVRARVHRRAPARARQALPRADQGDAARPEADRRRRQHLRRRGAVPRPHPPAPARRRADAQAVRGAARRAWSSRSSSGSSPRAPRSTTSATPTGSAARSRTAS